MKQDPLSDFRRCDLERLKLAAEVIITAAGEFGAVVPDPLESELVIFKGRVEMALLLPDGAGWEAVA